MLHAIYCTVIPHAANFVLHKFRITEMADLLKCIYKTENLVFTSYRRKFVTKFLTFRPDIFRMVSRIRFPRFLNELHKRTQKIILCTTAVSSLIYRLMFRPIFHPKVRSIMKKILLTLYCTRNTQQSYAKFFVCTNLGKRQESKMRS